MIKITVSTDLIIINVDKSFLRALYSSFPIESNIHVILYVWEAVIAKTEDTILLVTANLISLDRGMQ